MSTPQLKSAVTQPQLGTGMGTGPSRATGAIEVKAAPEVDERLYLLRKLEMIYESWPKPESHPDLAAFEAAFGKLRETAQRYYDHVSNKGLDARLTSLYEDLVSAVDTYEACYKHLLKVRGEAQTMAQKDTDISYIDTGRPDIDFAICYLRNRWAGHKNEQAAEEFAQTEMQ